MRIEPNPDSGTKRLQDKVILIINGLCESGRVLAKMLSQQGADIAITDSTQKPELALRIRQDVEANGRCCLLLTPNALLIGEKKTFSQQAIRKIMDVFGRLDAFVMYSAVDATVKLMDQQKQNDSASNSILFDQYGLTKAAMKQIIVQ